MNEIFNIDEFPATGRLRPHAQYLASWLSVLKADKRAIFTAASKASEATSFLAKLQAS